MCAMKNLTNDERKGENQKKSKEVNLVEIRKRKYFFGKNQNRNKGGLQDHCNLKYGIKRRVWEVKKNKRQMVREYKKLRNNYTEIQGKCEMFWEILIEDTK